MLKLWEKILPIFCVSILLFTAPFAHADNLGIECDYPGQLAEAGDTLEFDIRITNYANTSGTYNLRYSMSNGDDWIINFKDGEDDVSMVYISAWSARDVTLSVETPGDADVGEYPIYVRVGNQKLSLYVEITKTYKDEKGSLNLKVTNRDGDNIKGAVVNIFEKEDLINSAKTTSEGKISLELPKGEYNLEVSKEGDHPEEIGDTKIKIGRVTDLGF
ncbi:MAG: carboxypeptidase regulatory-like domain-containing protein, partial [Halobacteriota archaeon]|nr:carboxypeptidase regulatory-like domain-containing protein [Halobacteriota archaeon]